MVHVLSEVVSCCKHPADLVWVCGKLEVDQSVMKQSAQTWGSQAASI